MVYAQVLNFVLVAAVIFVSINILTPFLYDVWYNNLSTGVTNTTLKTAGNNLFTTWTILGYIIPGIIIAYGFATAARQGSRDQSIDEMDGY